MTSNVLFIQQFYGVGEPSTLGQRPGFSQTPSTNWQTEMSNGLWGGCTQIDLVEDHWPDCSFKNNSSHVLPLYRKKEFGDLSGLVMIYHIKINISPD